MSSKIRVALAGAGYVASRHLAALSDLPFVEIVAICDKDKSRASELAARFRVPAVFTSLEEMGPTAPQVIHMLTPPSSHCALALQALEMNCHVFVEKPMAESPEECDEMTAKAREKGLVLSVNHSLLFEPAVHRALGLLDRGVIGDLLGLTYFRGSDYAPYAGGPPTAVHTQGSYPFRDLGVHAIYLMERVLGAIKVLEARPHSTGRDPMLTFDEWRISAECEKGTAHAHLSWNAKPPQNEFWIQGTRGVLHVDVFLQRCELHRTYPGPKQLHFALNGMRHAMAGLVEVPGYLLSMATGRLKPSPGIYHSVLAFHNALRRGDRPPVSAIEGRRAVYWVGVGSSAADIEKHARETRRRNCRPSAARILVTGANGFLGSALVRRLRDSGERPRLFLRRPAADPNAKGSDVVYGNLGEPDAVERAVEGVEVVYHVGAAMKGGAREFEAATVWGTRNIVEASLRHKVKRLIHVSSLGVLDVAGHRDGAPVNESSPVEPFPELRGLYTQTKLEAERIVLTAVQQEGLPAVIIRPGQIFGPGVERVPPSGFIRLSGVWILAGNGERMLPLVYVEDVVSGLLAAEHAPDAVGRIIHLVDPTRLTQNEYLARCRPALEKLKVWRAPEALLMSLGWACDHLTPILKRSLPLSVYRVRSLRPLSPVDVSTARAILGWTPEVGVTGGLDFTFGPYEGRQTNCRNSFTSEMEPATGEPLGPES